MAPANIRPPLLFNIKKIHYNRKNTACNNSRKINIGKIVNHEFNPLTKNNEKLRNIYDMQNPIKKYAVLSRKIVLEKNGTITPAENQAAAIVLKNSDKALS